MYDTKGNEPHIYMLDNLIDYWQRHQHIQLMEKKQDLYFTNLKILFFWQENSIHWKFKDKKLTSFNHQIIITVVLLFCGSFL